MALLSATEIGLFRANPNANPNNNLKLTDPDTPGTSGTDTLARDVSSGPDAYFEGVTYQGKGGASTEVVERFFTMDPVTMQKTYFTIPATATAATTAALQSAITAIIEQYEVDPVVTVSLDTNTFTIVHKGAGTMDDVVIDGANVATTRS